MNKEKRSISERFINFILGETFPMNYEVHKCSICGKNMKWKRFKKGWECWHGK